MAFPQRLRVDAPGGGYDILVEPGLLERVTLRVTGFAVGERVVVVTNPPLNDLYGAALALRLPNAAAICMPDGEQYKNLETVAQLYTDFVAAGLDRDGTVIALGGGVVGDTAGFAAASYLRGVRLVQIPTSLLSMVDSSVGGKVGVDLPEGKNLVGAFKQPDVVLIDPAVTQTLPDREWRCGLAEVIKHGLLADEGLLDLSLATRQDDAEAVGTLVLRAVQVKIDIVQADPYERGVRAHLNLGHTFAHAVERVTGYGWPHGEAVAVGLVAAARLSHVLGLCDASLASRVEDVVRAAGLPVRLGGLDPEAIYEAMGTDKKKKAGDLRFVLLRGVGQAELVSRVPKAAVVDVLKGMQV